MPIVTAVFFALLSSAVGAWPACPLENERHLDATEAMPDLAVALQLSSQINDIATDATDATADSQERTQGSVHDVCQDFQLVDPAGTSIALSPRASPAKVIDSFAFVSPYEAEELLLRFYEMGEEVSEFHIVEGDRDFAGAQKAYSFPALLESGQLDPWKDKITYHQVKIPEGVVGYQLQQTQRRAMRSQMNSYRDYDQHDMLLEGDLDEIVSHKVLQALKRCKPAGDVWKARVHMTDLSYSVAWSRLSGSSDFPTTFGFVSEGGAVNNLAHAGGFIHWTNELKAMDGSHIAWHFSFMLNGPAALAHKLFIRVEGKPPYAQRFQTEAELADFIKNVFYADPCAHDSELHPSNVGKKDLPQALSEHPEKFPSILHNVTLS